MRSRKSPQQRREGSFEAQLEQRARELLRKKGKDGSGWSVQSDLEDQIALTLSQIERVRSHETDVLDTLLDLECKIGTELMQMEQRFPRYTSLIFPEEDRIKRRLHRLGEERRRFQERQAQKMDGLQEKLLGFVGKRHLFENGPPP